MPTQNPLPLELVVARYREDLGWLRNVPTALNTTVYDKGPEASQFPGSIMLPNKGREAHTYLHHILERYETLAEWTVFCQGKPFDHAFDFHHFLRQASLWQSSGETQPLAPFQWLGHLIDTDDEGGNTLFRPWSKNEDGRGLDLKGFHQALFGVAGPPEYTFVLGAQFCVHREVIKGRSREFYQRALSLSETFPDAAHCYERMWDRVVGVTGLDAEWLSGRRTVLLKPMKRQSV